MYYRNCIFLASDRVLQVTPLHEFKGAYHLSDLACPKEMVLIGVWKARSIRAFTHAILA